MYPAILQFAKWMGTTKLSYLATHYPWVWPTCETLHFLGLAMLFGTVGAIDLRLLGVGKQIPFAPLNRLVRWGVGGFMVNAITGLIFYAGDPVQYTTNQAFQLKLLAMALAGLNMLLFFATGIYKKADALGPGDDAPAAAKIIAGTSPALWMAVTLCGRLLPFWGTAF